MSKGGTAEKPIAIKAAGDGEVIFDGDGNTVLFNVMAADHLYFEGITFRNTLLAIEAGQKGIAGAEGLTVKHSKFEDVGVAIHSDWSGSKNFYIADNVMTGRNDPNALTGWLNVWPWSELPGFAEKRRLKSYYAVSIYGSGHVVAYNRSRRFTTASITRPTACRTATRTCPATACRCRMTSTTTTFPTCTTIASRLTAGCTTFASFAIVASIPRPGGMSPQPIFGGPVYFVRNVVYNGVYGPLKIQADPSGILVYQNTYVGEVAQLTPASNMHFRNNLILGQGARPAVFAIDTHTSYSSSDYNGFRANPGAEYAFQWNTPPHGKAEDFVTPRETRRFASLAEYSRATGQDRHSRDVDYDVFVNAAAPDFSQPTRLYSSEQVDLRLAPRSRAIDAGVELPGINDAFRGAAPDLGAYEEGAEIPHYGPRKSPR